MNKENRFISGGCKGMPLWEAMIRHPIQLVWLLDNNQLQVSEEIENQIRQREKQVKVAIRLAKRFQ